LPVLETTLRNVRALRLANPPVNALSVGAGLVGELSDALRRAATDPAIAFVILAGDSGVFSAGADINDFEAEPGRLETLRALIDSVESLDTPVVAAIDGLCLGGGLELALAAHYRVAGSTARFGFPEIALGLLPGGGGTQRLPRLVAPDIAIDMMLGGKQVGAARALSICLVDMVAEGDAVVAAHAFIAQGRANMPRRLGEMAARPGVAEALGAARPKAAASLAASHIVDSLAAACALGFRDGLAEEARLFGNLLRSSESRALRHGFFGRSVVRRIPDGAAATPLKIGSVTVVGAGLMGSGIALALVNAGLRVVMVEPREAGRAKALETIRTSIRRDADKGRIDADQASLRAR
jgi:3-hydroxyacyl-CoA dehydrogenase